jgi:hypothetical protein
MDIQRDPTILPSKKLIFAWDDRNKGKRIGIFPFGRVIEEDVEQNTIIVGKIRYGLFRDYLVNKIIVPTDQVTKYNEYTWVIIPSLDAFRKSPNVLNTWILPIT